MKKRNKHYRPRPVMSWMPTENQLDIAIMAHTMVNKLSSGLFDDVDSNTLAYLLNVSRRLSVLNNRQDLVEKADACMESFLSVRQRHLRLEKWGADGQELVTLRDNFPALADYFNTQPVHRIEAARQWVLRSNRKMKEQGLLYADVHEDGRMENGVMANVELRGAEPIGEASLSNAKLGAAGSGKD